MKCLILFLLAMPSLAQMHEFPGQGMWYPPMPRLQPTFQFTSAAINNVANGKVAMCGFVSFPTRTGTKDIHKLQFRFGTVVKAGGSGLTVSLQDMSTTAGLPASPDGTQDQTAAIANGDTGFDSNLWYTTAALSADRTVTYGDPICAVVEWDGGGRLGSDSYVISAISISTNNPFSTHGGTVTYNGTTWALQWSLPDLVFEMSDGTFGTIETGFPAKTLTRQAYASSNTPDEYALEFSLPFTAQIDAFYALGQHGATARDFDMVLYSADGTAQRTVTFDGNFWNTSLDGFMIKPVSKYMLAANTTYRLSVKPTTTSAITLLLIDVNASGHWALHGGPNGAQLATRTDAGSWSTTATSRPMVGFRISAIGVGASAAPTIAQ